MATATRRARGSIPPAALALLCAVWLMLTALAAHAERLLVDGDEQPPAKSSTQTPDRETEMNSALPAPRLDVRGSESAESTPRAADFAVQPDAMLPADRSEPRDDPRASALERRSMRPLLPVSGARAADRSRQAPPAGLPRDTEPDTSAARHVEPDAGGEARPLDPNDLRPGALEALLREDTPAARVADISRTEPPSTAERLFRERYDSPLAAGLSQFGYEVFSGASRRSVTGAPPADYRLGPGDELRVRIMGTGMDDSLRTLVDDEGAIDLPGIGVVPVAGLTLHEVERAVREVTLSYVQGVEARVSLERLRQIEVTVLGEVERPGVHLVSPFAGLLHGLIVAGGVRKSGSLRQVRLTSETGEAYAVDLYDLLLHGDAAANPRLAERDVIFVPRLGPVAAAAGDVSQPGIYELAGEESTDELLQLAGGLLPQGLATRLHLRRFEAGRTFSVSDLEAATGHVAEKVRLQPGDLLEARAIDSAFPEAVRLRGHVRYPDSFAWRGGLRLKDVLNDPGQLLPEAVTDFGLVVRYDQESTRRQVLTFPLARLLAGSFDMPLAPRDAVVVLSREELGISEPVFLQGAVWREGRFEHRPGMTLVDLLALGGGLRFGADPARVELVRRTPRDGRAEAHVRTLSVEQDRDLELSPYDSVRVPRVKGADEVRTVHVDGEVRYPGAYTLVDGERLSDLLRRAGDFTEGAYFYGARFTSARAREVQQKSLDRLVSELSMLADRVLATRAPDSVDPEDTLALRESRAGVARLLDNLRAAKAEGRVSIVLAPIADLAGSAYDFPLADGDALHVPRMPSFVTVTGSVYTQGSFLHRQGADVADYLERAGGPTRDADPGHIYLLKANGEVLARDAARGFDGTTLMPGDTLVVPEDLERVPHLRLFKGLADIVFKIATTAGIAIAIL